MRRSQTPHETRRTGDDRRRGPAAPTREQRRDGRRSDPPERTASDAVEDVRESSGRPLSPTVRRSFERRFGTRFSDVRVHDGAGAEAAASALDARAFTTGRHLVFGADEYDTESLAGRRLLAHELAHVVHQRSGEIAAGGDVSPQLEAQAEAAADAVVSGGRVPTLSAGATAGVQRQSARRPQQHRTPSRAQLRKRNQLVEQARRDMQQQLARLSKRDREQTEARAARTHRKSMENVEGFVRTVESTTGTGGTRGPARTPIQGAVKGLEQLSDAVAVITGQKSVPLEAMVSSYAAAKRFVLEVAATTDASQTIQWYGLVVQQEGVPVYVMVSTNESLLAEYAFENAPVEVVPLNELSREFNIMVEIHRRMRSAQGLPGGVQ
jgi:hypothetical protein